MKKISLTQYLVEQQREHGRIPGQLRLLIEVVARACKRIAIAVIAMNAVSFFVYFGALGQILGQGLRLHQLESRFPGRLFSHEALPQLEAARRDSWPARLFR